MVGGMKGLTLWSALAKAAWLDQLPPELKNSVMSLYGTRLVFGIRRAVLRGGVQVEAMVATRERGDCKVFVEATGFGFERMVTECSCPVGKNCKHAYAALLAAVVKGYRPRNDLPQPAESGQFLLEEPLRASVEAVSGEEAVPTGRARPVLRLIAEYPFTGYVGWYSGVPYGENVKMALLEFEYDAAPGQRFPYGSGKRHQGEWQRDFDFEREASEQLVEAGMVRCGEALSYALKSELRDAFIFHPNPADVGPWVTLLMERVPGLTAAGWVVETAEDFALNVLRPDGYYEELVETGRRDWFAAEIGFELAGCRYQLLPLLVKFMEKQPGALRLERLAAMGDEAVLVPVDENGGLVPVPASRLHRILSSLTELISGGAKQLEGGRMPVHRLRAAAMASMPDNDDVMFRVTAERLRGLAAGLREGWEDKSELPAGLEAELRPYQIAGWRWLRFLSKHSLGGVLADDMGLGKTLQTLAMVLADREAGTTEGRPTLIVCPTSLVSNWRSEARKFCPALTVTVHHGTGRTDSGERLGQTDLVITSYPILVRDEAMFRGMEFHAVVLDEAQNIKNPRTRNAVAACGLKASARFCLTGTPMENHLGELWSLYHFVLPGFLGTRDQFTSAFRTPIERLGDRERREALVRRIGPVFLRRTKQAVLGELPPKIETIQRIPLSAAQADLYESVRAAMDARVHEEIDRRGMERSRIMILDALLKLRQVCCHPQLLKVDAAKAVKESAKLEALMELVEPLVAEGRRMLVFSQFVEMLQVIRERLKASGIEPLLLTGQTKKRGALVEEFQKGASPVFLISLKAGGTGLNLTAADTVIHYDPWWNPAAEAQATDRAHRMGQRSTVFVHKLICEGTIEERILELQQRKSALVAGLLDASAPAVALTAEDLEMLLSPIG